jgi:acetolactate synthase small subunit
MDKNIAAILREDAKTCTVAFQNENGSMSAAYTYVTHLALEVGDLVVVPSGNHNSLKIAEVMTVDDDLEIEPNSDIKYKWVADVIDVKAARENRDRNMEIEKMLASTYRVNARQAYAQQFLSNADPKVIALVKGQ